ncbi:hypothetical protein Q8A64_17425 [Oxalobacteraceae bacterium R-40]|uniref:Response regulatory domain-containing protein n=1 Tax=Keguizhuia sedimenti TaxID=3064264 RepID=A0ABU1BT71_9BURK|nr:hypothetical protein [Oxalobacteraceae bacterium R-40]
MNILSGLGYKVLKASDGQSALVILQSGRPIDMLFTDVVMPGPVRSPDLAKRAKELHPNIEVLFTSGYTQNAIVHGGRLDPGVYLVNQQALSQRVSSPIYQTCLFCKPLSNYVVSNSFIGQQKWPRSRRARK